MLNALVSRFVDTARRFRSDRRGNVAMIFGIAAIPTVLAVGGFIDYERGSLARAQMQDALDATALALHTDAATMTQAQMNDFATKYFAANFNNGDAFDVVVTPNYDQGGPSVTVTGSAKVNTNFLPIIGIDTLDIGAQAVTTWGQSRLRVALVLDNTGSMSASGKIDALKTATKNLLTQLKQAATVDGDVYVSIIPFSRDVNVGTMGANASWIDWNGSSDSWDNVNGSCSVSGRSNRASCEKGSCNISGNSTQSACEAASKCSISGYTTQSTCQAAGVCSISSYTTQSSCTSNYVCSIAGYTTQSSCQAAGVCSNTKYTSKSSCQGHEATWSTGSWKKGTWSSGVWTTGVWSAGTWTPASHTKWNGCIMDRNQNFDISNAAPNASDRLFPAHQYSNCPSALTGLSYDWTALNAVVDSMVPNGSTNQTIGLAWGWQSLTQSPFTIPAFSADYKYKTIIILLSDGVNTQDRWYGNGSDQSTQVDAREALLCSAVKAANVTIYAIQVNTDGAATQSVMQNCASDTDKFFLLTTADQIITTFDQIGKALSDLRLSS